MPWNIRVEFIRELPTDSYSGITVSISHFNDVGELIDEVLEEQLTVDAIHYKLVYPKDMLSEEDRVFVFQAMKALCVSKSGAHEFKQALVSAMGIAHASISWTGLDEIEQRDAAFREQLGLSPLAAPARLLGENVSPAFFLRSDFSDALDDDFLRASFSLPISPGGEQKKHRRRARTVDLEGASCSAPVSPRGGGSDPRKKLHSDDPYEDSSSANISASSVPYIPEVSASSTVPKDENQQALNKHRALLLLKESMGLLVDLMDKMTSSRFGHSDAAFGQGGRIWEAFLDEVPEHVCLPALLADIKCIFANLTISQIIQISCIPWRDDEEEPAATIKKTCTWLVGKMRSINDDPLASPIHTTPLVQDNIFSMWVHYQETLRHVTSLIGDKLQETLCKAIGILKLKAFNRNFTDIHFLIRFGRLLLLQAEIIDNKEDTLFPELLRKNAGHEPILEDIFKMDLSATTAFVSELLKPSQICYCSAESAYFSYPFQDYLATIEEQAKQASSVASSSVFLRSRVDGKALAEVVNVFSPYYAHVKTASTEEARRASNDIARMEVTSHMLNDIVASVNIAKAKLMSSTQQNADEESKVELR